MSDAPLYELLRRCHPSELVPLAELLGVRHRNLGPADLAGRLERVLRQRGGHEIANLLLRRGSGPPWSRIVGRLARRAGVPAEGPTEAVERALLAASPPPAPSRLRRLGPLATIALLAPLGPLAGLATLLHVGRPRDRLLLQALQEIVRLREVTRRRITLGVVGSPSSGKDAAIRALFGIDTGRIDPVAGSTREVAILRLPGPAPIHVVNTPGLGDVEEAVTERARQILDLIDVFVYVVNAQGGVRRREKAGYDACVRRGRPVLAVVNKIDTLRPADRERFLADTREKLGAPTDAFLAAAFDPLPALAPHPIGVDAVRGWLADTLRRLGKDPEDVSAALGGD